MKKWTGFALFTVTFLIAFSLVKHFTSSTESYSSLAPTADISRDLLAAVKDFQNFISDPKKLTFDSCATDLSSIYNQLNTFNPEYFDTQLVAKNYNEIIRTLFLTRLTLRDRLKGFISSGAIPVENSAQNPCLTAIRNVTRVGRYLEDYLGEVYLGVKNFDEKTDPLFYGTFTREEPWLEKSPQAPELKLRSGDLILSRGGAYTSAAIARIGIIDSQFSHLAVFYVKGDNTGKLYTLDEAIKNPNAFILEAHIEIGTTIRPIKKYLEDGNVRNVLFRFYNAAQAHEAAAWSYNYLQNYRDKAYAAYKKDLLGKLNPLTWFLHKEHPDFSVPYDFKMDMSNIKEVFCSEVGSMGFAHLKEPISVPLFKTTIEPGTDNDLVNVLGITTKNTFAPGDLEFDTRFEMLAEWRDYRKVHTVRYKDAILTSMFTWMKDYKYKFFPNIIVEAGATIVWLSRYVDIPRIAIGNKVIFDVSKKLPKNMTPEIAYTVETLDRIGVKLEARLNQVESEYKKNHQGLLMSYTKTLETLEKYRQEDSAAYKYQTSNFHEMFRPSTLSVSSRFHSTQPIPGHDNN